MKNKSKKIFKAIFFDAVVGYFIFAWVVSQALRLNQCSLIFVYHFPRIQWKEKGDNCSY